MKSIPNITDELLSLIRHGEDYQIEYKEARKELPKSLFDTVSSFSNREGGDIFLDVHDCGVIMGVDPSCTAKLITNFGNLANNKDKLFPPTYLTATEYVYRSEGGFSGTDKNGKVITEEPGEYHILHIHIPIKPTVVRHRAKVGPGTSPVASGQVVKSSGQVYDVITVKLDVVKLNELLEYCKEARTRSEMQEFCEISSRDYFRKNILVPLLNSGRLQMTIPDKPNSSKQKYIKA